jgi:hypothetical protein
LNKLLSIPFCLLLLLTGESCLAVDPSKQMTQYAHAGWRIQDGFFNGLPTAIAQTTDGYTATGVQEILEQTNLPKGDCYHHFVN